MLHANMVPLLPQVFSGTIEHQAAKMSEMGGQNVDTTVVQGGINIAGIEEVRSALYSHCDEAGLTPTRMRRATWNTIRRSTSATRVRPTGTRVPSHQRTSSATARRSRRQRRYRTRTGALRPRPRPRS